MGGVVIITRLSELSCSTNQDEKSNRVKGTEKMAHRYKVLLMYVCVCDFTVSAPSILLKFVP